MFHFTFAKTMTSISLALISIGAQAAYVANSQINLNSLRADKSMPAEIKAQAMADAAERLVAARALVPATQAAREALNADPANPKARLLSAALAPELELRGLVARVEPLIQSRPEIHSRFKSIKERVEKRNHDQSLVSFLSVGPQDIATEAEVQEVFARYINKLDELRRTLNDLKNGPEITIALDMEALRPFSWKDATRPCVITTEPGVFDLSTCPKSGRMSEYTLNQADLEAAQQATAGYQILFTLLNAWDLSGSYKAAARFTGQSQSDLRTLLGNKSFGTLRQGHAIGVIPDLAKDAAVGIRYATSIQDQLCPKGKANPKNRQGYVFANGFCVKPKSKVERQMAMIELAMQGPQTLTMKNEPVTVNAPAFFRQPVGDVRTLLPAKTGGCGRVSSLKDKTLGGLFPRGEIERVLGGSNCRM